MNFKTARTDLLFARPSFGSGVARALDLFGAFDDYNSCSTESEADQIAIGSDWSVVGCDLNEVIEQATTK